MDVFISKGLDEGLAEATNEDFYETYMTWVMDTSPTMAQKVVLRYFDMCNLNLIQGRYWVRSWQAHLGNRATPRTLVDVIIQENMKLKGRANNLKDQIQKKFNLDN